MAPMPLNVGLNYVKEKGSGCLPSLLRHSGKYRDILLRSHQLLSLTSPVPYIAFHLCMILCCFSHFLCYFPWHICRWIYLFLNFPAFPHLANRAVNELLSWCWSRKYQSQGFEHCTCMWSCIVKGQSVAKGLLVIKCSQELTFFLPIIRWSNLCATECWQMLLTKYPYNTRHPLQWCEIRNWFKGGVYEVSLQLSFWFGWKLVLC